MKLTVLLLLLIFSCSCIARYEPTGCSDCDTIPVEDTTETVYVRIPPFLDPRLTSPQNQARFGDFLNPSRTTHSIDDISYYSKYTGSLANDDHLLYVTVSEDGRIYLNSEPQTSAKALTLKLAEIFHERELNGVFEEGSARTAKAVGIRVPTSAEYGRFFEMATAVRDSGADPIVLLLDGHLPERVVVDTKSGSAFRIDTDIRSVDFANFTYPWPKELKDKDRSFTLTNGKYDVGDPNKSDKIGATLVGVKYGEVTGDHSDDAIVIVSLSTGGSSTPGIAYVFTWKNGGPAVLWSTVTGDRADGGYRDAYAKDGNLVIEVNNPDESQGDCCPIKYDRIEYVWGGNGFVEAGKKTLSISVDRGRNLQ